MLRAALVALVIVSGAVCTFKFHYFHCLLSCKNPQTQHICERDKRAYTSTRKSCAKIKMLNALTITREFDTRLQKS